MKVSDLMSTEVHTCTAEDALHEPARLMWTYDVGVVPVVDGQGQVVGMLTDRDIAMAAFLRGQPLSKIDVGSTMSRAVHSCRADEDVQAAEKRMAERQIRRLPVIDQAGVLVGILSVNDLARAAARAATDKNTLVQTLSAISHPRRGDSGNSAAEPPDSTDRGRLPRGVRVYDAPGGAEAVAAAAEVVREGLVGEYHADTDDLGQADLDRAMDALRQRRDELRLQMHLARAEARDEWERAEEVWRSLQGRLLGSESAVVVTDVQDLVRKLLQDIGEGYRRIRQSLQAPSSG